VYNLAGPVEDRPDYLKSIMLGSLLTQKQFNPGEAIREGYKTGVGLRLRSYHRWARTNYKQVGISTDRFYGKPEFDPASVAAAMLADFEIDAEIDWIDSGSAEIEMWGRQWMRENLPLKEPTDTWRVDYVEATGDGLIVFDDGTPNVLFTPTGYRGTGDYLYVAYSRILTINRRTSPQLFIYRRGSGSLALDALFLLGATTGEYLPQIPLRHENRFLSESYKPEVYAEAKKAYKKASGQKYDELISKIEENPDLEDIDFAYIFFGVSLNTVDMSSRRYMFRYFKHLLDNQTVSSSAYDAWLANQTDLNADINSWTDWYGDQLVFDPGLPTVGTQPVRPVVAAAPENYVIIEDKGPGKTNLKIEISWKSMTLSTGSGLGRPEAVRGDVWFTFVGNETIVASAYTTDEVENLTIDTIEAWHQVSDTSYEKIVIKGMVHKNHIYNGKSVTITAAQALLDESDSEFLIPIRYDTFREMSLVDSTQMSTQCVNIVFNCYQIVKKPWYARGWFKVFVFVAVVVLTILYPPAGAAAGAATTVGTAAVTIITLNVIINAIISVVVNMILSMLLMKIFTHLAVQAFGEKVGQIVAALAMFITMNVGNAMASGQSLASSFSNLMSASNLLAMTNAVGNAYASMVNVDTMEMFKKTQELIDKYRQESLELQERYADQFGYGTALFNPMALTEAAQSFFTEPSETFLSRTLLTGSEIAEMSNNLITNFAELTLRNPYSED
jgi:hypothetical protein